MQVAVLVAGAAQTVFMMVGQHKLEDGYLRVADNLGVGMDVHAFPYFGGAGGQESPFAGDFDGAQTAMRLDALVFVVAQVRNVDANSLGCLHDFRAFGHFDRDIVDG